MDNVIARTSLARANILLHLMQAGQDGLSTSALARTLRCSRENARQLLQRLRQSGQVESSAQRQLAQTSQGVRWVRVWYIREQ